MRVDLNCDLGESFGGYKLDNDRLVMPYITSANIACGVHSGDTFTMRETVRLAIRFDVSVGAHPSFPDPSGFGRQKMDVTLSEVEDLVLHQVSNLVKIASTEGAKVHHVKPHGALYNMAARDIEIADAIARTMKAIDPDLVLFGLSGSCLLDAGRERGLRVASEVFADRAYHANGDLVSRTIPGAVIDDSKIVVERVLEMIRKGTVIALNGEHVALCADTICIHSDTPGVTLLAKILRAKLERAGVSVLSIGS